MPSMVKRMNVHRKIAILLLICFSAFLGHNLVPHHHLSEDLFNPFAASCPIDHGDHRGNGHYPDSETTKDQQPTHCHAFNDVVFEKFNSSIYSPKSIRIQDMAEPEQLCDPDILQLLPTSTYTYPELVRSSRAGRGIRALRAPPSLG